MNLNANIVLGKLAAVAAFTVCITGSVSAQNTATFIAPGKVAPRMLDNPENTKVPLWNNSENFGTIPGRLAADSVKECATIGSEYKPVGYHPDALDKAGTLIAGGGFLCLTQENIDKVAKSK